MDNYEDDFEIVDSDNSLYDDEFLNNAAAKNKVIVEDDEDLLLFNDSNFAEETNNSNNNNNNNEEEEEDEYEAEVEAEEETAVVSPKKSSKKSKKKSKKSSKKKVDSANAIMNELNHELKQAKKIRATMQEQEKCLASKLSEFDAELLLIKKMKSRMEKQCHKYSKLVQENSDLKSILKKELTSVNELELQLKSDELNFSKNQRYLSQLLTALKKTKTKPKKNNDEEENDNKNSAETDDDDEEEEEEEVIDDVFHVNENRELLAQLRKYFVQCQTMKNETKQIELLHQQQSNLIQQSKIHLETMRTNHRDHCLISLDKSQSYSCKECNTDIGLSCDIESKCYQVGQGSFSEKKRGYLFNATVNLVLGEEKTENFTTGAYQISWVSCVKCQSKVGWKYISSDKDADVNRAKVGKYCLARYSLTAPEERVSQ